MILEKRESSFESNCWIVIASLLDELDDLLLFLLSGVLFGDELMEMGLVAKHDQLILL